MPNGPFEAALADLTIADVLGLVRDAVPEGAQLDFKRDLSAKDGGPNAWHSDRTISERAKRELARMVVEFANADGGTVVVGIRESDDHPARAADVDPLPAVAELADRVRRALLDLVDPAPDRLEVAGVPIEGNGGVLILRTPPSMSAPHRVATRDGFGVHVRRGDQTVEATMREVHDIVLRRESGAERFERVFRDARDAFGDPMRALRSGPPDPAEGEAPIHPRFGGPAARWAVGGVVA